jgi:excinuclease ABC subunit A
VADDFIRVEGARQNNLKGLDLRIPLHELIVVTGVSGSGKSSLAFDTVYAEGQRRYVETFSPYARQFLDRMDRPRVDRIEGIPPAIAIDQTNPVRTSRSTVGTMTELNDHLKLIFARAARLHCRRCGKLVRRDTAQTIAEELLARGADSPGRLALVTFPTRVPAKLSEEEVLAVLAHQGYTRIHRRHGDTLEVIQDRVALEPRERPRLVEGIEAALRFGQGRVAVHPLDAQGRTGEPWRFSADLHCADCDLHYEDPQPSAFSFNSPIGACATCRGFGRTIGIDWSLVIPDESKTLAGGALRPWQTEAYRECQRDLVRLGRRRGIPLDVPWRQLSEEHRRWVIEGEGPWKKDVWYGARRFFAWLESRAYRMHVRVLLSRYRAYTECAACGGARLKSESSLWRLGTRAEAERALPAARRFRPAGAELDEARFAGLPGLTIHDVMLLPIERCHAFFRTLELGAPLDEATDLVLGEIRSRLRYLVEVGLGYLTLDRQSRTLSGGEVQRINLTTALGTSLVNTLFVLDEPSIGLHARDMGRVVDVLHRLRDAGNSLLVVEHDPQVMLAADRVLDLGPGPGERGGEVVFFGPPAELIGSERSLTAAYLRGERRVLPGDRAQRPRPAPDDPCLEILGAAEHNLKGVDVRLPLGRLVCVAGVSGSGKSTLLVDVMHRALLKLRGAPVEAPGRHAAIRGHEHVGDVVLVDQSPIGKTARSNPASYVGALDAIRKLFAAEPLSRERGYGPGTFSFNSGTGRCATCTGSGFEHVEMQFLSDVYLRCPDCDGRRYRGEVLEVKLAPAPRARSASIADVLEMTVDEAVDYFAAHADVRRALEPLAAVGLGYVRLGQPVPTLSGGEAQRLKLAGHLAQPRGRRGRAAGSLFLLDEPTTGLHFDDIARLLAAFERLLAAGHSLVVIEHNLDVLRAADWIVELGPEGGDAGGELVCEGTPAEVARAAKSPTGEALRAYAQDLERTSRAARSIAARVERPASPDDGDGDGAIRIRNAREHNLQGIDVRIPRDQLTVVSGISGSGKSTLAFDILFAEGQRRYLESLNAYARQFVEPVSRPDVDAISGIPPTVAVEQRTSRGGRKSTVATLTEVYHFLRLLFVKLGRQHCPACALPIEPQTPEAILARILREQRGKRVSVLAPLVVARKGYYTDLARWAAARGFARLRVDGKWLPTEPWPRLDRFREHDIDLPLGEVAASARSEGELRELLARGLELGKGTVRVARTDGANGGAAGGDELLFSTRRACPSCARSFAELDPRLFSYNSKHGWCPRCFGTGLELEGFDEEQSGEEIWWNAWWEGDASACSACDGRRLRPEALAVRFHEKTIAELAALSVEAAETFFRKLRLAAREARIARDIVSEIGARLGFLREVGLGYLSLDRAAPTLSGGEAQRIRLAAQLGSNLRGVCYVLDEPTIGLHARDNRMLLATLERLKAKGNTVVVVEHDEETIRRADYLLDLGPGAGASGGRVVAQGSIDDLLAAADSVTGRCLASPLRHPWVERPAPARGAPALRVVGADLHNLKRLSVSLPLGRLVCITGVSGSGKSTLARDVLHDNLRLQIAARARRGRRGAKPPLRGCRELVGGEAIGRVLEVDQAPIGKTPRSCPATYVGFWDDVRRLFAGTPQARMRGWGPGRFSFNVKGGRCEACEGQGVKTIELSFLPDVKVACDACGGARFDAETRSALYRERSVSDVLAMSVDQATEFFAAHASIHRALRLLQDVGLGYLTLGQPSPTLSGGEAQRIKLVTELAKVRGPEEAGRSRADARGRPRAAAREQTLYVLDEPTIGLHMADVEKLVRVLHRLVAAGNTIVLVEHNLDVIAEADWILDLGPEGGTAGGRLVAEGPPETVARARGSHTGHILGAFLAERGRPRPARARREQAVEL